MQVREGDSTDTMEAKDEMKVRVHGSGQIQRHRPS